MAGTTKSKDKEVVADLRAKEEERRREWWKQNRLAAIICFVVAVLTAGLIFALMLT
jgi:hypothetical protein